jgi:ATP-dependent Lon protease
MIALLGEPGLGKSYICESIGMALGIGYHMVSLNGKKDADVVYGTEMSNPGAEPGEIVKGISRSGSKYCLFLFDEIEKAGTEAKRALGNPTDRTVNKNFKDRFFDFPTPCNNCLFFAALNYAEEMPDFVRDRFQVITVQPPTYQQRIDILRTNLASEFEDLNNAFLAIYHRGWKDIYAQFNQEALLKKALTKTFSIRKSKDNIVMMLVPTLIDEFLEAKRALPNDIVNYN